MSATVRLLLAVMLTCASVLLTAGAPAPAARAADGSAVTVRGSGPFADLEITVGQTRDLINQTVRVSWQGGKPTGPAGNFGMNYLQIMQCWGDEATGPTREQCQYGALAAQSSPGAGDFVRLRQVSYGNALVDPLETYRPEPGKQAVVPVTSVRGKTTTDYGEFFDAGNTNEVPLAKTRPDGTGEADVEVLTALESYGLGCGGKLASGKPRSCWLVVVPRNDVEVNGRAVGTDGMPNWVVSSPLAASNWRHRIAVPLQFRPVETPCPIGAAETPTSGHEFVNDAILRWKPAMCSGGGPVFAYNQVPDAVARGQLLGPDPGLAFVTLGVPPDAVPPDRRMVYAPVAVSGLTLAFVTERQSAGEGVVPEEVWRRDGQLMDELNLTPRLVAKLLTQSYALSIPTNVDYLDNNPPSLTKDPDFLAVNPDFTDYGVLMSIVDAISPSGDQDAIAQLWSWVDADREARAFLDGEPDPWGMRVNPNYRKLALPVFNFPKADLTCAKPGTVVENCALTLHPLAHDMHEAGRGISRGDTLGKQPTGLADPEGKPELKRVERQPQGRRGLIAVTDTATAARYGLATAKLRNAAGRFVAPTTSGMLAGVAAMRPSGIPGVVQADPQTKARAAYPLTNLSYAVTPPAILTRQAGRDYAGLLRFAVGPGQRSGFSVGELPLGYAPLPAALRAQARSAATEIERTAGKPIGQSPGPGSPAGAAGGSGSVGAAAGAGVLGTGATGAVDPAGAGRQAPADAAAPQGTEEPKVAGDDATQAAGRTPATPLGWVRYGLAAMLVVGGLAAGGQPLLQRLSTRVRR